MADNLKVYVDGLIRGGSDIAEQATVLSTLHRLSMVGLSESESGWLGSSADALVHMAESWQQVADRHHAALIQQAAHVAEAARAFQSMDERSAAQLEQVGEQADAVS